jgi:hypothetical protein
MLGMLIAFMEVKNLHYLHLSLMHTIISCVALASESC